MQPNDKTTAICYVDASYTRMSAGGGYVARAGDRLILGAFPLEGVHSSNQAEARIARMLVDRLLDNSDPSVRIDIRTDSKFIVTRMNAGGLTPSGVAMKRGRDVTDDVAALEAHSAGGGARLSFGFCKGHVPTGSAAGFLNHCADQLAKLGATGKTLVWDLPFDAFWRFRIMGCHERLMVDGLGLTLSEGAQFLGVTPRVVSQLLQHGHVDPLPNSPLLCGNSINVVRRHIGDRGHPVALRSEPLPPMRGRIDEAGSGFGQGPAARSTIQVGIEMQEVDGEVAAVILLEGDGAREVFALRFPQDDGPLWRPVVDNLLDLVWDRHPDCDRIVAISSDEDLIEAMNGRGPNKDDPSLNDIDEHIRNFELTVEFRPIPGNRIGWRTKLVSALMADLVENGAEGAWSVSYEPETMTAPTLGAFDYEAPWVSATDLGPRP